MPVLQQYLDEIVRVATGFVGSHYLHGGAGNEPDKGNGHPWRPSAVRMRTDVLNPPGRNHDNPPRQILNAAWCDIDHGPMICAGRSDLMSQRKKRADIGDLRDDARLRLLLRDPQKVLWPRPNGNPTGGAIVFGEACQGVRHFDCIGLVNYCVYKITHMVRHTSIQNVNHWWVATHQATTPLQLSEARAGDLLVLRGTQHIAIALGGGRMVHARSEGYGVLVEHIDAGKVVLRPTEGFFSSLFT
jgi:cell wall-associated NlpC family hydrolase